MNNVGKLLTGKISKKRPTDAGYDIYSNKDIVILEGRSEVIGTDLRIELPEGHVGLIWPRSGMSVKHSIEVGAGCIDYGYTGEILVHLYNHGTRPYKVNKGDRIAQLLTLPVNLQPYIPADSPSKEHDRGESGFGESGK